MNGPLVLKEFWNRTQVGVSMIRVAGRALRADDLDNIVIFIGAPRSGTTLLGHLMNSHPQMLIANESRLVQRTLYRSLRLFPLALVGTACRAYSQRREGIASRHSTADWSRFQKRWVQQNFDGSLDQLDLSNWNTVGDKKSGGAIDAILARPEAWSKLASRYPNITLVHTVRHPMDSAASYLRSHPHEVDTMSDALRQIVRKTVGASKLLVAGNSKGVQVSYRRLVTHPEQELAMVAKALSVNDSPQWLAYARTRVRQQGSDASKACPICAVAKCDFAESERKLLAQVSYAEFDLCVECSQFFR